MNEHLLVALVSAVPATIAAVVSVITLHRAKDLKVSLNGRLEEWIAATKAASHAEGMKDEQDSHPKTTKK